MLDLSLISRNGICSDSQTRPRAATRKSAARASAAAVAATAVTLPLAAVAATNAPAMAQEHPNHLGTRHIGIGASEDSMNFSWRSHHKGTEFVKYYPTDNPLEMRWVPAEAVDFGAIAYDSKHATLTGLRTGTEYTYQVGSDKGGWSQPATFTTQAPGQGDWSFIAFSDAQLGIETKVAEQSEAWRYAVRQATGSYPDAQFILHAGDQVQGAPLSVAEWEGFFSPEETNSYPVVLVMGNHELRLDSKGRHFNEHANLPNRDGEHANYYFVRDNVLFIVLDTNENSAEEIEMHADYVREVVDKHNDGTDWTIVSFHHAPYSHGGRYVGDDRITRIREGLAPVFSETGVDLVINGHDHMYNRTHPMNGTTPRVPAERAEAGDVIRAEDGEVVYVTLNSGSGSKFYNFHDRHGTERKDITDRSQTDGTDLAIPEIAVWNQDYTADYTAVEVGTEELTVRTHNVADDSIVDEFTIVKEQQDSAGKAPVEVGVEEPVVTQAEAPAL